MDNGKPCSRETTCKKLVMALEDLGIQDKGDDILLKIAKTFLDTYRELKNLKKISDVNEEDALTLMVKHEKSNKVDELKPFLGVFDTNYYSKLTGNSAFSYAVEQNNLIFAEALLDKMSGKNEETREFFQRDLSNLSKQCTNESEIFKEASKNYFKIISSSTCRDYDHSQDCQLLISAMTKALIYKEGAAQEGCMLRNGKVTLQINNQDFQQKQFLRHFSTLLYRKWKEENRELAEVQAMWVFYPQDLIEKHQIFVAVNPYKKTFDEAQKKRMWELSGKKKEEEFCKLIKKLTDVDISSPKNYNLRRYNRVKEKFDGDLKFILDIFKSMKNSLQFEYLSNKNMSNYSAKHAEEILCDKAHEILENNNRNPKFYIYGKRRPCLTCYSRMEIMKIHHFNRNHEKFWPHGMKVRDSKNKHIRNTDVLINTLKLLSISTIHVTLAPDNTHHDDWDTDSEEDMVNQRSSTRKTSSTPNSRIKLNQPDDLVTGSVKDMSNQNSLPPKRSSTPISKIKPNESDDLDTCSNKDGKNLTLFTPKASSIQNSRIKRKHSYDSETGSDKDATNQSSFTPKRLSTSSSRIKKNQSDDFDAGSDKDVKNLTFFTPRRSSNQNGGIKRKHSYDSDKGCDKNTANEISFSPKRSSPPNTTIKKNKLDDSDTGSDEYMASQILFTPKRSPTPNLRVLLNSQNDKGTSCDKGMTNQSSCTPKSSANLNSSINLNLLKDSGKGFDHDMVNQISLTPKRPSTSTSRMNPSQPENSSTHSNRDIENQSSFTPKRSSNPINRIKGNLSDDSDEGSDKDLANQSSFKQKRPSTSNSTIKKNQRDNSDTCSDEYMASQVSSIPKR